LNQLATLSFSTLSMTLAISLSRTGAVAPGRDDGPVSLGASRPRPAGSRWVGGERADRRVGIRLGQHGPNIVKREAARRRRHRIDLMRTANFASRTPAPGRRRELRYLLGQVVWPHSSTVDIGSVGEIVDEQDRGRPD
jgi:hypothetical protein